MNATIRSEEIESNNEADGNAMYPGKQHNPTDEERYQVALRNPETRRCKYVHSDSLSCGIGDISLPLAGLSCFGANNCFCSIASAIASCLTLRT